MKKPIKKAIKLATAEINGKKVDFYEPPRAIPVLFQYQRTIERMITPELCAFTIMTATVYGAVFQ